MSTIPNMPRSPHGERAADQTSSQRASRELAGRTRTAAYIAGLRRRRHTSRRIPGGDPWRYESPGPRGVAAACEHLYAAGCTPVLPLDDLRAAWEGASDLQRKALIDAVRNAA